MNVGRIAFLVPLLSAAIFGSGAAWTQAAAPESTAATSVAPPVAALADASPAASIVLPASSAVPMRFLENVSSSTHVRGQHFELQLTDDITAGDQVVIPAGSVVTGEVIHAQKAGMLGKAGELIIAARYVTVGTRQIKLRAQLMRRGEDKTMAALFIVPFIRGKDLVFPAETEVIARTVVDETFTK
jgi:hypothetical protein